MPIVNSQGLAATNVAFADSFDYDFGEIIVVVSGMVFYNAIDDGDDARLHHNVALRDALRGLQRWKRCLNCR